MGGVEREGEGCMLGKVVRECRWVERRGKVIRDCRCEGGKVGMRR